MDFHKKMKIQKFSSKIFYYTAIEKLHLENGTIYNKV